MFHFKMIEYARHNKIHQILKGLRLIVKSRVRGHDAYTQTREFEHVFKMYCRKRRFAWHQNEFALFLNHDIRCALDKIITHTIRDRGQCVAPPGDR